MKKVYDKAIELLKIRPHHSFELTKKLLMRGFDREEVASVIQKLQEENLIDNAQFAQAYLDELIRNKSFGFYGLKAKLMSRGIASNEAEQLLKENLSLEKEKEIALQVVERTGDLDKVKLAQKLQRKGFRGDVIREVIK
jgi:regulatory protein